jgi:hypothetical protein
VDAVDCAVVPVVVVTVVVSWIVSVTVDGSGIVYVATFVVPGTVITRSGTAAVTVCSVPVIAPQANGIANGTIAPTASIDNKIEMTFHFFMLLHSFDSRDIRLHSAVI